MPSPSTTRFKAHAVRLVTVTELLIHAVYFGECGAKKPRCCACRQRDGLQLVRWLLQVPPIAQDRELSLGHTN